MRYQIPGHGQSPTDWQCRMPYLVHLRVWRVSRCGQLVDRHVRAVVTVGGAQLDWRVPQHRPSQRACVGRLRRPHPGAGPPLFAHGEGTASSGVPRRRISVQVTAWSGRRPLRSRRSRRAERSAVVTRPCSGPSARTVGRQSGGMCPGRTHTAHMSSPIPPPVCSPWSRATSSPTRMPISPPPATPTGSPEELAHTGEQTAAHWPLWRCRLRLWTRDRIPFGSRPFRAVTGMVRPHRRAREPASRRARFPG